MAELCFNETNSILHWCCYACLLTVERSAYRVPIFQTLFSFIHNHIYLQDTVLRFAGMCDTCSGHLWKVIILIQLRDSTSLPVARKLQNDAQSHNSRSMGLCHDICLQWCSSRILLIIIFRETLWLKWAVLKQFCFVGIAGFSLHES